MRAFKTILMLALAALVIVFSGSALAFRGGGHVRFGVFVGAPFFYPGYYPYYYPAPYYYPPYYPPAVVQSAPTVYVEQATAQPAPAPVNYWYYCAQSKAYYPYVKECAGGWQRVTPQPAPQ